MKLFMEHPKYIPDEINIKRPNTDNFLFNNLLQLYGSVQITILSIKKAIVSYFGTFYNIVQCTLYSVHNKINNALNIKSFKKLNLYANDSSPTLNSRAKRLHNLSIIVSINLLLSFLSLQSTPSSLCDENKYIYSHNLFFNNLSSNKGITSF